MLTRPAIIHKIVPTIGTLVRLILDLWDRIYGMTEAIVCLDRCFQQAKRTEILQVLYDCLRR